MRVVYVYQGGRDPALEAELAAMGPGARTGPVRPGMQGMVEVTLLVAPGGETDLVHHLRRHPRVVDAAAHSLGEGV